MKKGSLILAGAAACLSIPASAALQSDGAALVAKFMEAVRADPVLLQAAKQNRSGAAASAIPALLSYTRANPRNAEGWYLLSMAYGDTNQHDLAKAAIRRATAIKPELDDMTNYLAGRMARPAAPAAEQAENNRPPAPAAAGRNVAALPSGQYNCLQVYYDSMAKRMQTNHMGHINIRPGGAYDWMGKTPGRYKLEGDTVRWSGGIYGDGSATSSTLKMIDDKPAISMEITTAGRPLRQTCHLQR